MKARDWDPKEGDRFCMSLRMFESKEWMVTRSRNDYDGDHFTAKGMQHDESVYIEKDWVVYPMPKRRK